MEEQKLQKLLLEEHREADLTELIWTKFSINFV